MTYYSTLVQNIINNDLNTLQGSYDGYVFKDYIIKQGDKSIGINYNIDPKAGVTYDIKYFNEAEDSIRTISIEDIDSLFILTVEEYMNALQNRLASYESGVDDDGHLYIDTGDYGWMGYVDGQYVIASYGNMQPDDILNELCYREVTNHSKAHKRYNRKTETYEII